MDQKTLIELIATAADAPDLYDSEKRLIIAWLAAQLAVTDESMTPPPGFGEKM